MNITLFEILRAFAVFCVVCAHVAGISEDAGTLSQWSSNALNTLGTFGVPVFYIISGFFFNRDRKNFKCFWQRKVKTIFIPWVFSFSLLWFYVVIRKGGASLWGWFSFVMGYNTTAYYLFDLIFFYLFLFICRRNRIGIAISTATGLMWHVCCYFRLYNIISGIQSVFPNKYMNPFYFLIWFSIGMMIDEFGLYNLLCKYSVKYLWMIFLLNGAMIYINNLFGIKYTYFCRTAFVSLLLPFLLMFGIAGIIDTKMKEESSVKRIIKYIGKYSFTIYLTHQLFAGFIVRITNYADCFALVLLRPVINIFVVILAVRLLNKINDKLNGKNGWAKTLIGMR